MKAELGTGAPAGELGAGAATPEAAPTEEKTP
jgi:hypothetical protein